MCSRGACGRVIRAERRGCDSLWSFQGAVQVSYLVREVWGLSPPWAVFRGAIVQLWQCASVSASHGEGFGSARPFDSSTRRAYFGSMTGMWGCHGVECLPSH